MSDEIFEAEFMTWWEEHGQYCRAGGGDYERTFAFEAWRHLYPKLMQALATLSPAHIEGGEEVEVVAWQNTLTGDVTSHQVQLMDWDDEKEPVEPLMTVAQHQRIVAALSAPPAAGVPEGKLLVSAEPLRRVLNALVNAPHQIRELQATREPVALFADNPINILIAEYNAAHGDDE